ncbi:adenylyl-sulfate kinase [Paraburkholderia caribensis]|uniref:adenylyl-sulfate kinase n=1 Tax=Paraburkholderia caribensis TaxID=75105 RepID=UPI003CD0729D
MTTIFIGLLTGTVLVVRPTSRCKGRKSLQVQATAAPVENSISGAGKSTLANRSENIRQVTGVAKPMANAGLVVTVATNSPIRAARESASVLFGQNEFF